MKDSASQAQRSVDQKEQLLDAVAFSAKELLSTNNWASRIDEILRRLGEASASSRVYVFRHNHNIEGKLLTSLVFEWCAQGITPQIDNPDLKEMEIGAAGFQRWIDLMSCGKSVSGTADSFPDDERELLESQSIKAFAVIPFFVSGTWWGFIGFDQCDRVRGWSQAELGALQAAASMIGSAIERQISEVRLQDQFHELKKTNQELDFFVYSVSHDLRAPLASLLGLINIAGREEMNFRLRDYLIRMRDSVFKLDLFIREVLDYSQNARLQLSSEFLNLKTFLEKEGNKIISPEKGIALEIDYRAETGVVFHSDKKRLEIVFANLMSNAVNFRDPAKMCCEIRIRVELNQEGASIQVEDNGIGIEDTHLEKIFQMFYRATEYGTGSGLGLYIVKEVVLKLGGWIKVESLPKEYTRFNLWIPSLRRDVSFGMP